jgi:hypothetical protein
MDFKQYRLTDWAWIRAFEEKYGSGAYHAYFRKVCNALDDLKPGYQYNLLQELSRDSDLFLVHLPDSAGNCNMKQDTDLFIKVCCTWILTNNEYGFSDDYTLIKRYA